MIVPFLSFYLNNKGISLGTLGVILSAGPIASVIFGIIGGHICDRWGRKPVQILGVTLSGFAMIGFSIAGTNVYILALLNFLNGMTRSFYRPATTAAMSDFSPPEMISETIALNKIAINIAYGGGPLLGYLMFTMSPQTGFIIAGSINLLVGLFLALIVPESLHIKRRIDSNEIMQFQKSFNRNQRKQEIWQEWKQILKDTIFWLWLFGNIIIVGTYNLIQSFLLIHFDNVNVPLWTFSLLLVVNAIICAVGQMPASRLTRSSPIGGVSFLSKIGFLLGFTGFAFLRSPILLILSMLILSIGEIIGSAVQMRFVPERTSNKLLGRYMGLLVISDLGRSIFSFFGGFVMQNLGGSYVFVGAAIFSMFGGFILWVASSKKL